MPGGEVSVARRKTVRHPCEKVMECVQSLGVFLDLPESVLVSLDLFQPFSVTLIGLTFFREACRIELQVLL